MTVRVFTGRGFQKGHERRAFGEFLQDLINRYDASDVSFFVIGEVDAGPAKMDLLLISSGALIIADIKELTAADKKDADELQLAGKQNGQWEYLLPDGTKCPMGGYGKKDNPYQQLERIRFQFSEWLTPRSSNIFGSSITKNQILDRLGAWCVISPGFNGDTRYLDLPWNDIQDNRKWFQIHSLKNLAWEFNCASNSLLELSDEQIIELITQLGATECKNLSEILPVPSPVLDPFFSKPHLSGKLVDRVDERQKLVQFLGDENTSVISLRGLGGVGKTELAAWISKTAQAERYDIRWIDCLEKEVTDESFLAAIASEISNPYDKEMILNKKYKLVDRMEAALSYLSKKPTLIIINDFHKISPKTELDPLLTHIIHHYSQIKVILTTREYPACIDNPRWRPGAARDILVGGLPQDSVSEFISLDTNENISQDWEKTIYERTSGNPYALRLASTIGRRYRWGDQVAKLPLFNAAQTQESRDWFDSLMETVSDNAKQLAIRLSVIRTGLTQSLINFLWHQPEEAMLLTQELIDGCILQKSEAEDTYLLHEFIREYLYEQLSENRKQKSHLDAGKHFLKLSQDTPDEAFKTEYLVEAFFHFRQANELEPIRQNAVQCHKLLIKKGDRDRAQTVATYALEAARFYKDDVEIAGWLVRIAEREIQHDQLKDAGRHLEEALIILTKIKAKLRPEQAGKLNDLLARTFLLKGRLAYLVSDFPSAKEIFDQALGYAKNAINKREEVSCLVMMGHLARQKKEYDEAYQFFHQASDLASNIHDPELENECFSHLGLISRRRGDFEDAKKRFTQVYENAKKQGNRRVEQTNLNLLGDIYLRQGEYSQAEPLFRQGLFLARKYAIGQGIRICMGQLAEVLIHKGEFSEAKQLLDDSEELCIQVEDGIALAWTISRKGLLLKAQGYKEQGNQIILSGIQKLREMGNEDYIADFENFLNSYQ